MASVITSLMTMSGPPFGFLKLCHGPPSTGLAPNSFTASW